MMAVRPSVRPNRITRLPLDGFETKLIVGNIYKTVEKIQIRIISDMNNGYFTKRQTYLRQNNFFGRNMCTKSGKVFMFNSFLCEIFLV